MGSLLLYGEYMRTLENSLFAIGGILLGSALTMATLAHFTAHWRTQGVPFDLHVTRVVAK